MKFLVKNNFFSLKKYIFAFLFLLPFLVYFPNASSPFEFIKLNVSGLVSMSAFCILLWSYFTKDEISIHWNSALSALGFLLLITTASYFFSIDQYLSFWGDDQMPADSLATCMIFFVFSFTSLQVFRKSEDVEIILTLIVTSTSVMAAHGILQHFGYDFAAFSALKSLKFKSISTIGQPAVFAGLLGAVAPVILMFYYSAENKLRACLFLAALALNQAALFYAGTRMPFFLNLLFLGLVSGYFIIHRKQYAIHKKIALVLVLGGAGFSAGFLYIGSGLPAKLQTYEMQKALESRVTVWKDGLRAWKQNLLLGSGPETFYIVQKQQADGELNKTEYWRHRWTKAHNSAVQALATTGILGFMAFLILPLLILYKGSVLFFKSSSTSETLQKLSLASIFLFITIANLTAFNFLYTQLLTFLLPVLLFSVGGADKVFLIKPKSILSKALLLTLGGAAGFFANSVFRYWSSDVHFQNSFVALAQNENTEALAHIEAAILLNENNPFLHCHKGNILLNTLIKNRNKLSADKVDGVVQVIDDATRLCTQLGVRRFEPYLARGTIFSTLYFEDLVKDDGRSRESILKFKELAPSHPGPDLLLAALDEHKGFEEERAKHLQRSIDLKADFLPAYRELVRIYVLKNDHDNLNGLIEKISGLKFTSSEFMSEFLRIEQILKTSGDLDNAEKINKIHARAEKSMLIFD